MFRIESYVTSLILSYVERYIKNFKIEDAQVSLWEGDGSFQNLNLDLEVLEEELNLPFSFVSGHIHELLIHVPWTRITSESVKVTINTIECVMKLKPLGSQQNHSRSRRSQKSIEAPQTQASLVSSLVNKIISNLSVTCNNLILKYVEEDIVLSMNIKTLSFGTVDKQWQPAFLELNQGQLEVCKLISLSDITICLDKRNASGRIESYLEPLLYRCFVTVRLWQSYDSETSKQASSTRVDMLCEHMAFTVSEPQIPMLLRLMTLCLALHHKELSSTSLPPLEDDPSTDKSEEDSIDDQARQDSYSWTSWAIGWMPTLLPLEYEDDPCYTQDAPTKTTANVGLYIKTFALALKLCEPDGSGGVKTKSQAFMHILLRGCRWDMLTHNATWTNLQMGICEVTVRPDSDCCCGVKDHNQMEYLTSGSILETFVSGSLFDKNPTLLQDRLGYSWKHHLKTVTEAIMLERSPALAIDSLSCNQDKEEEEEEESDDDDRFPIKEKVIIRYVVGPLVLRLCSGLIHRVQMVSKACDSYDYLPYVSNTSLPVPRDNQVLDLVQRLSEKSIEMDEDLYERYLPLHTSQFTAFHTVIEIYPANHMPIHLSSLGRKLSQSHKKSVSSGSQQFASPPCVIVEWKCAYGTMIKPLYPDKILLMASKFHREKLPLEIVNTSLTRLAFKAVGVCSRVRLPHVKAITVIDISNVSCDQSWHSLITPLDDQISSDIGLTIEHVKATSSKAKLLLVYEIVSSLVASNNRNHYLASQKTIHNTSLLQDATATMDSVYLKVSLDKARGRRVVTALSTTSRALIDTFYVSVMRLDKGDETLIVAAPETLSAETIPFLEVVYQQPISLNQFPPLAMVKVQDIRLSVDPLVYIWLLYQPLQTATHSTSFLTQPAFTKPADLLNTRKVSESSMSSYKRRAPTPQGSIPSSSERETAPSQSLTEGNQTVSVLSLAERVASSYSLWKVAVVCAYVSRVSVYLPHTSLFSSTPRTMEGNLKAALQSSSSPLHAVVIKLASVTLHCGNCKQDIDQYTADLPVRLPPSLWAQDKDNFPWVLTISDVQCYTLHGTSYLPLLKPVSLNCTIGLSPKLSDRHVLTSLALCVHLDTSSVTVKLSEEQVVLIVKLLAGVSQLQALMPGKPAEYTPTSMDMAAGKVFGSDVSTNISPYDGVARTGGEADKVKMTGWLQWTLARTTLSMYNNTSAADKLKLALDIEDVILSVDVERVYHKLKLKVATASVYHYVRASSKELWEKGTFQGLVMRGYDPDTATHTVDESQGPAGFLTATVTRALCSNFHSRLGSLSKYNKALMKLNKFITEVEVKMQPLDFVLSPTTLGVIFHTFEPLLSLVPRHAAEDTVKQAPPATVVGSGILPLLYLDLMNIRVVLPVSRHQLQQNQPDVLILQFDGMTANPQPENPICRNSLRPDIYHKAQKEHMLNVTGSELEDRQYQFNLTNLTAQTGNWAELEKLFVRERTVASQQNPALDWNEGRSPMLHVPAHQLMTPLVNPFKLSVVLAPAMFYMSKDIVCGHAAEVNAESDIVVTLTLDQLYLCGVLSSEILSAVRPDSRRSDQTMPITFTPATHHSHPVWEQDSGVESTMSSSTQRCQIDPNVARVHAHAVPSSIHAHALPSSAFSVLHSSLPSSVYPMPFVLPKRVPCELLITGSVFIFSLFRVDHRGEHFTFEPLFHSQVSQPHVFLAKSVENVTSCQVSVFDISASCGVKGHTVTKTVVTKPCPQPLVMTRSGVPHPKTRLPPAFFTGKAFWSPDRPPKIEIKVGRPVRIICNLEIIDYLKMLQTVIITHFIIPFSRLSNSQRPTFKEDNNITEEEDHFLRKCVKQFSKLTLNTDQLVLEISSISEDGAELCISVGECSGYVTSTLHTTSATLLVNTATMSTRKMSVSPRLSLLLDPWTLSLQATLSWDSWLSSADPPLFSVTANCDVLSIHLSPDQLFCLTTLKRDYALLFPQHGDIPTPEKHHVVAGAYHSGRGSSEEEQHYHEDLQTGPFQFVYAPTVELPPTYQVVFCNNTMSWRYPQPRSITKMSLRPIPFEELEEGVIVDPTCVLQYYSEAEAGYNDYTSFTLSQTDTQQVDLPQWPPRVVATTWRVVMSPDAITIAPVNVLAAAMYVDSFFSPLLIPSIQLAASITSVNITLWTCKNDHLSLPVPLDRYFWDGRFPEDHDFVTVSLEQANISFLLWPKVSQQMRVKGRLRVELLNYDTLCNQCCVVPFPLVASGHMTTDCQQWSFVSGHVNMTLGPALSHSLLSSIKTWTHNQPVLTPFVVCNNSSVPIRFRQAGSDEHITLQCFQCHLYSWRTMKCPKELEFGLSNSDDNEWSKGVLLHVDSSVVVKLKISTGLIISVRRLSPTVCQVVVNGQLGLHNSLSMPVEVLITPDSVGQVQSSSLAVQSGGTPPTIILDLQHQYTLKLRFNSTPHTTFWSGEIPINRTKQWEVKIPLGDKEHFRSVWCHVVWTIMDKVPQVLVILSPLYTIKSMLPCEANVLVETPAQASALTVPITGRGAVQPLDTPGLSTERHNLTFQLDGKVPASSPPVAIHYHMLHDSPSSSTVNKDVPTLLSQLERPPLSDLWPYLGVDWACVEWLVSTQPDTVTHVKVRFSDDSVATKALLVEVRPWALLVNTLGCTVYLQGHERTLCSLVHRAVISPPPLESTFQIGVELASRVELSDPIQLKRGLGFEMPHIPGLLPATGFINTTITSKNAMCFMNVNSSEVSGLRLIHLRSSFVVASLCEDDLEIIALAVKHSGSPYDLPANILTQPLNVRSDPVKCRSQPLTQWKVVGEGGGEVVLHLMVSVNGMWSCPVQVLDGKERQSVEVLFPAVAQGSRQLSMVLTSEQVDGQTHLLLWDQPCPQYTIHNLTTHTVLFAKAVSTPDGTSVIPDCEHIRWQLTMAPGETAHYTFPLTPNSSSPNTLPTAVIAVVQSQSRDVKWSEPISLSQCSGRLLTLLGLPDLSLSVSKRGFTTHITLTTSSHTEILAVNIRDQLSRQLSGHTPLLFSRRASVVSEKSEELVSVHEASPPSFPPSESGGERRGLDVSCYVHGLTFTLLSESELGCECHEVAALTMNYISLTMHPHPHQDVSVCEMKVHLTVGDVQLDNQEFPVGGYDFPVVMLMQKPPELVEVVLSKHALTMIEKARSVGSAFDLTVVIDTNSHSSIVIQDVSLKLRPFQIYVEDKYILHLKECLMKLLPSPLDDTLSKPSSSKYCQSAHIKANTEMTFRDPQRPLGKEPDVSKGEEELSEGREEEELFNVSEPEYVHEEIATNQADSSQVRQSTATHEPQPIWAKPTSSKHQQQSQEATDSVGFPIPRETLAASQDLARPLRLRSLSISELDLLVSIHTSTRLYIALDHSPLQLAAFKRSSLFTNAYRLGHSLTLHYFFGAIYGTGWALGSLEMLGAPGGLARSLGLGLKDFITLPIQGILLGPSAFFAGIAHGSASLMQHFAAGTITSVTRMASSWARTLDRLTLDHNDLEQSEQQRRQRPQSLSQGVTQGLTVFFTSLIGGIGSIAHHPLQHVISPDRQGGSLANSIGMGLVGVVTRPLSGVAELVALTGQGLLSGVGWTNTPKMRHEPDMQHDQCGNGSRLKYQWKLLLSGEQLLLAVEATTNCYQAVTLLVTNSCLYVLNAELDIVTRTVNLAELRNLDTVSATEDPTLVAFKIQSPKEQAQLLSQSRVVEFVQESQRALFGETSDVPGATPELEEPDLQFFINPQARYHFLAIVSFAKKQSTNQGFPVIN